MNTAVRSVVTRIVPLRARRLAGNLAKRCGQWPPKGTLRFGSFRSVTPIGGDWGFERGTPVDRYYIENFLRFHAPSIGGRVLEIDHDRYTRKFGGERVTHSDILHIDEMRAGVTMVGDLTAADHLPSDTFDCIILTQTLNLIFDVEAAIATVHRLLKPGGTVLATAPGITRMTGDPEHQWGHCWGFTTVSLSRLFRRMFEGGSVDVQSVGNVLSTMAFLHGLSYDELRRDELDFRDPELELLVTVRAIKAGTPR